MFRCLPAQLQSKLVAVRGNGPGRGLDPQISVEGVESLAIRGRPKVRPIEERRVAFVNCVQNRFAWCPRCRDVDGGGRVQRNRLKDASFVKEREISAIEIQGLA